MSEKCYLHGIYHIVSQKTFALLNISKYGMLYTLQGDSGGPIQIASKKNQCIFYVVGVTSFGKYCASKNTPGVYTRVSTYISWIESIVWPQN